MFFALWITLTIFLWFVNYGISDAMYLWVSITFGASVTVLRLTIPRVFERLQRIPFPKSFKFKSQKCEINVKDEKGRANVKITSRLVNVGNDPISDRKHVISISKGELPEEDTLTAVDEDGHILRHTFITKSKMVWDSVVEFRSPIPRLGEIKYSHSVENVARMYPKDVSQHSWSWKPVTVIDALEIEVLYDFDVKILGARLIDMCTGRVMDETETHTRSIISKARDLGPGEYKLVWNTE